MPHYHCGEAMPDSSDRQPSTRDLALDFIDALYLKTGSNQLRGTSMWDLGRTMGWPDDTTRAVFNYARERGWAASRAFGGSVQITVEGIDLAEGRRRTSGTAAPMPSAPSASPVNVNINAPLTSPVFQIAGAHSTQKMEVASGEAIKVLNDVVSLLGEAIRGRNDDVTELRQLRASLETVEAQLASPAPRKTVLLEALRSIMEDALGSALGAFIASAAPSLPVNRR